MQAASYKGVDDVTVVDHMRGQENIKKLSESRKADLNYLVKRDYIRNGIATIPCRVSDYNDVISAYSVKGCETLNPDFAEYLKSTAAVMPQECPLVLNIIGDCLSQEEKETIEEIILDDYAYDLGIVEEAEKRNARTNCLMLVGLILSGTLLWLTHSLADEPRELFYILFWFAGETLCDYFFLTGHDLRRDRRLAGRLASIKVIFSDRYEDPSWTEHDVEKLYSEIEKDVNETCGK